MRRLIFAAALTIAGAFASGGAQALPGSPAPVAVQSGLVENVALVCRPVWNGYRWAERCYHTQPRYYAPPRHYHRRHSYRPPHHHHRPHRHHHHHRR